MESFANRVDKVFGSLQVTSSSWRLSPEKQRLPVKKHVAEDDLQEEEEEEEEDQTWDARAPPQHCSFDGMDVDGDLEAEGLSVRQMVGLDTTLDYEDEEDEFDKAAFGLDGSEEDRLYMKGVKEDDRKVIASRSLPSSFYDLKKLRRDPRANHKAAKARLEEDAKAATSTSMSTSTATATATATCTNMTSMEITEHAKVSDEDNRNANGNATGVKRSGEDMPVSLEASAITSSEERKPPKRVRFALNPEEPEDPQVKARKEFVRPQPNLVRASQVPDHVRNPSKYTHYTLDWSLEDNEMSNFEAFKACTEAVEGDPSFSEEKIDKVQFVHKHERTFGNPQKSNMEEADRPAMAISKTMCVEHLESGSDNVEMLHDDAMDFNPEDSASGFHILTQKARGKATKNFRTRKESEDGMDT